MKIPKPLLVDIAKGRCLPFIGAGFCMHAIVDQHVLRAWSFLTKKTVGEPEKTLENLENYKKYKLHFFELARQSGKDLRDIDRALMAFGQFLKSQFFPNEQAYKVSS